ncbi:DUF6932 family protein [Arthrobacter sp. TMN-50]
MVDEVHPSVPVLPIGRRQWSTDEIRAKFCPTPEFGQTHRQVLWQHFELATQTLRSVVPVAAVWIGGSFLTSKESPGDVDAVYIVRARAYDNLTDVEKQQVSLFSGGEQLKARGLSVDSYVIHWAPRASNRPTTDEELEQLLSRGYWDDWLQRHKVDRAVPASDEDSYPTRGYVEVILDGYATDKP